LNNKAFTSPVYTFHSQEVTYIIFLENEIIDWILRFTNLSFKILDFLPKYMYILLYYDQLTVTFSAGCNSQSGSNCNHLLFNFDFLNFFFHIWIKIPTSSICLYHTSFISLVHFTHYSSSILGMYGLVILSKKLTLTLMQEKIWNFLMNQMIILTVFVETSMYIYQTSLVLR
jgi:hypothetical protein